MALRQVAHLLLQRLHPQKLKLRHLHRLPQVRLQKRQSLAQQRRRQQRQQRLHLPEFLEHSQAQFQTHNLAQFKFRLLFQMEKSLTQRVCNFQIEISVHNQFHRKQFHILFKRQSQQAVQIFKALAALHILLKAGMTLSFLLLQRPE